MKKRDLRAARVAAMEEKYDLASEAVGELAEALEKYLSARKALTELDAYLSSGNWLADYEADEAGLIPEGIKRGVLSQDGVYDLLAENERLKGVMLDVAGDRNG